MYIWHKDAKRKKVSVIGVCEDGYQVVIDGNPFYLPMSEYEECPPPEPPKIWHDVTRELEVDAEGIIARLPDRRGSIVINTCNYPQVKLRLMKHDGRLYLHEFR